MNEEQRKDFLQSLKINNNPFHGINKAYKLRDFIHLFSAAFPPNGNISNRLKCIKIIEDNPERFLQAQGSSHNHQAWESGYIDHITAVLKIAIDLYRTLSNISKLPFNLYDAFIVLFLHDLEKPWKTKELTDKVDKRAFREDKIKEYNIQLTEEQQNALLYVEGEGDDYRRDTRVMNELAAFCHMCDVASARIWHSEII